MVSFFLPFLVVIFKEVSFKYPARIHRSLIMLHEGLIFSFPDESSWGKMSYSTLNIIKNLMGVTTEELHQMKEGSFQKHLVKFGMHYACSPLASH